MVGHRDVAEEGCGLVVAGNLREVLHHGEGDVDGCVENGFVHLQDVEVAAQQMFSHREQRRVKVECERFDDVGETEPVIEIVDHSGDGCVVAVGALHGYRLDAEVFGACHGIDVVVASFHGVLHRDGEIGLGHVVVVIAACEKSHRQQKQQIK